MSNNQYRSTAYGLSDALLNVFPAPIISNRAPTTADMAQLGTIWDYKTANAIYILSSIVNNSANWVNFAGGAGVFTSITVNPGDITVVAGDIHVTAGSITAGAAISAGTGLSTAAGNIVDTNGNIIAGNTTVGTNGSSLELLKSRTGGVITSGDTLGNLLFAGFDGTGYVTAAAIQSVNSGTIGAARVAGNLLFYTHPDSVTAATLRLTINPAGNVIVAAPDSGVAMTVTAGGLTVTAGDIIATAGNITASAAQVRGATLVATGDVAGIAAQTAITNVVNTTQGAGALTLLSTNGNAGTNTGFIKIYVGGVVNYIPYFVNIAP